LFVREVPVSGIYLVGWADYPNGLTKCQRKWRVWLANGIEMPFSMKCGSVPKVLAWVVLLHGAENQPTSLSLPALNLN
jgi:hypothetical protein